MPPTKIEFLFFQLYIKCNGLRENVMFFFPVGAADVKLGKRKICFV